MSLTKDFQILTKLGEGAYSIVYKVLRLQDNNTYALKKVKIFNLSQKQKQNALNQIRILASIQSKYIVGYKQAFFDEQSQSLCLVMQFAENGDLLAKINEKVKKQQSFDENQIMNYFISIVKGLKCLHTKKILHRDIKTANIFLHQNIAKLGDLNVSKIAQEGLCNTQTGTPYYASPQVWKDQPYNQKSDIWSLGCILYEMICLKPPFYSDDLEQLYKKVNRGIYSKIPSKYSNQLASLIRLLLQVNPDQRPTCQKILESKIVKKHIQQNNLNNNSNLEVRQQLLKTIKPTQNFTSLNNQLPRAKYDISTFDRKNVKSVLAHETSFDQIKDYWKKSKKSLKQITEIEQLPILQNQPKITPIDHTQRQRYTAKQKQSYGVLPTRNRKKSELQINQRLSKKNLQSCRGNLRQQILELRLPKLYGRTRKNSQKYEGVSHTTHSKSVRNYKVYNTNN